jgi:FkbM family methyltransferase
MKRMLKPGMNVLDLGANIGYFSVIAAALVGEHGEVHAFEPMPQNLIRLRKNLEPFSWAMTHQYAVANITGEIPIHCSDKEAGWASYGMHCKGCSCSQSSNQARHRGQRIGCPARRPADAVSFSSHNCRGDQIRLAPRRNPSATRRHWL